MLMPACPSFTAILSTTSTPLRLGIYGGFLAKHPPKEEEPLGWAADVNLSDIRRQIEAGQYSDYDRKKLNKWLESVGSEDIEIAGIQRYIRGFIYGICYRLIIEEGRDVTCVRCNAVITRAEMVREPWAYHVNPLNAGVDTSSPASRA